MTFASRSSQSTPPETKSTGPRFAALATKCALQGSPRATNNLLFPALNKVCSKLGLLLDALDFALVNHKTHASGWNGPFLLSIYPRVANNRLAPRWTCSFALEVLPFLRPRMTKGMSYIYIYISIGFGIPSPAWWPTHVMLQVGVAPSCPRLYNQVAHKRCDTLWPLFLHNNMLRYAPSWNGAFKLPGPGTKGGNEATKRPGGQAR